MNGSRTTNLTPANQAEHADYPKHDNFAVGVGTVVVLSLMLAWQSIEAWAANQERRFHRRQLLDAYRRRHNWKKADIPRLRALGVNAVAEKRMEQLSGRGRPVVKPHRALHVEVLEKLSAVGTLVSSEALPQERRKALKQWPWWPHYVEALYRGEHALAKARGVKAASTEAEILVGRSLGISASQVHAICGDIRRKRGDDPEFANFPAMTLAEYQTWVDSPEAFLQCRLGD